MAGSGTCTCAQGRVQGLQSCAVAVNHNGAAAILTCSSNHGWVDVTLYDTVIICCSSPRQRRSSYQTSRLPALGDKRQWWRPRDDVGRRRISTGSAATTSAASPPAATLRRLCPAHACRSPASKQQRERPWTVAAVLLPSRLRPDWWMCAWYHQLL